MRIAIPIVLLLAACKGGSESKDPPAVKPTPGKPEVKTEKGAGGFDKVKVEIDGKPVAVTRAFIKKTSPDQFQLYLSNQGGSCTELLDNVFDGDDAIVDVLVDLTPRLAADGGQHIEVSYIHEGGATINIEPGSKATVGGDADKGAATEVTFDFVGTGSMKVEAHGSFVAEGCGFDEPGTDGVPRVAHPSTATVTIAGKKLAIRNAIIKGDEVAPVTDAPKVRDIILSTGPIDCSGSTPWAEVILERHWGSWKVSGTWFKEPLTSPMTPDEATSALVASLGATGTSDDGPTIAVELAGAGTLEGYGFELAGTIEALDCGK